MIDAMIFSRNRPMQLHALLKSVKQFTNLPAVTVLHRYDEKFKPGLEKVMSLHPDINFLAESDFESQVKDYLKTGQKFCVFFVDDMLFKRKVDVKIPCQILEANPDFLTFSLRLGTHLTYCYPMNSQQEVPNGNVNSGFFMWGWKGAHMDWGYPFSVDGHVFRRNEIQGWTSHLKFANPNQLESNMQLIQSSFALPNAGLCHLISSVFNMPINRVQHEFQNRSEEVSVDELYDQWMSGNELDIEKAFGILNDGAHTPLRLPYRKMP